MLNITPYYRNPNQNHNEVSSHICQNGCHQKGLQTINAGEGVEKSGGNANWYSHCGEHCGDSLKNLK